MPAAKDRFKAERAELEALLGSGVFHRSPNLQKFLTYVCEKYFEGATDGIREYSVAVEALGRSEDFDQKKDSIVRVEAYRLRRRLDEFYRGVGASHAISIELSPGSYVPRFVTNPHHQRSTPLEGSAADLDLSADEAEDTPDTSSTEIEDLSASSSAEADSEERDDSARTDGEVRGQDETSPVLEVVSAPEPDIQTASMPVQSGVEQSQLFTAADAPPRKYGKHRWLVAGLVLLLVLVGVGSVAWKAGQSFQTNDRTTNTPDRELPEPAAPATGGPAAISGSKGPEPIRILAGFPHNTFVDSKGRNWMGDSYFSGGVAVTAKPKKMMYTSSPGIYAHRREGEFSYAIPLNPGLYELRLHFMEQVFGLLNDGDGGETSRLIDVRMNGKVVLRSFDIFADAFGENRANVKVFKAVQPGDDGFLRLSFSSVRDVATLSAIEILPTPDGLVTPIRVVASERGFTDRHGKYWGPDDHVLGGRFVHRKPIQHPDYDPGFFSGERYGHFKYVIPVAREGRYRLRLFFCERWWGGSTPPGEGPGMRRFDVLVNGQMLLSDFDVYAEAGGPDKPVVREFSGLKSDAQGKLIVKFVPRENYALVNAIEVTEEGQ